LFLAMLFGPGLEEEALVSHREGIPYMQALDAACNLFMEEMVKTVTVPGRIGSQLRRILSLQPSLHRIPPRRPAVLVGRPEFADAMTYLIFTTKTREESRQSREWWKRFINNPVGISPEALGGEETAPVRKRKKKRRGRRPAGIIAAPSGDL
jgi:hypothetical protein